MCQMESMHNGNCLQMYENSAWGFNEKAHHDYIGPPGRLHLYFLSKFLTN